MSLEDQIRILKNKSQLLRVLNAKKEAQMRLNLIRQTMKVDKNQPPILPDQTFLEYLEEQADNPENDQVTKSMIDKIYQNPEYMSVLTDIPQKHKNLSELKFDLEARLVLIKTQTGEMERKLAERKAEMDKIEAMLIKINETPT